MVGLERPGQRQEEVYVADNSLSIDKKSRDAIVSILQKRDFSNSKILKAIENGNLPENVDVLKRILSILADEMDEFGVTNEDLNEYGLEVDDLISIVSSRLVDIN